jgi:hypothetical protein
VESRERDQALSQIDRLRHLLRQLQRASIWPAFGEVRSRAAAFRARRYRASHCQQPTDDDRKDPVAHVRVPESAAPIAVRFTPVFRAWM